MERHTWRGQTEEGLRIYRASHHGGRWTLQSQEKGAEDWIEHDTITDDEWRVLRDILWRKYQRRRCPWKLIEAIDRHLADGAEGLGEAEGKRG